MASGDEELAPGVAANGERDPTHIDARPTKDFFIFMLTRDIELVPAIADLVDNSVDGALSLREDRAFEGLWVKIEAGAEKFTIRDNCGGIEVETARDYAFRFGRPAGFDAVEGSIGQFGVGMKRALFKLGKKFTVTSTAARSRFTVTVAVDEWRADPSPDWHFNFDEEPEVFEEDVPQEERGTTIEVVELYPGVAEDFERGGWLADLRVDLETRHQLTIASGLEVEVNGDPLEPDPINLAVTERIRPAKWASQNGVSIEVMAGISNSNRGNAGWYVFCNNRLILRADKTEVTGFGFSDDELLIPKFHNQYARFRGYAFFEAEDSALLPWNTTKTSVDLDVTVYRQTVRQMRQLARPVLTFLNDLADEIAKADDGPLRQAVVEAEEHLVPARAVEQFADTFVAPEERIDPPPPANEQSIQYVRPIDRIEKLKELLDANSAKEVGEKTFDNFYDKTVGRDDDA